MICIRPQRLRKVRKQVAIYLQGIDPATEVPARDLLPGQNCRATPYLYSDADIAALMAAAGSLRTPHRVATYRTLIALLAVSGMRVGEAISPIAATSNRSMVCRRSATASSEM